MRNIKPFNGSASHTIVTGGATKDTDLINIDDNGHASILATINTAGITVTPTVYLYFGADVGWSAAQTLTDQDNSDATTFTSSAAFMASLNKQSWWKACLGFKIRFTFGTVTVGAICKCEAVVSGDPQ